VNSSALKLAIVLLLSLLVASCAGGNTRVSYGVGVGYGGYYGAGPWRGYYNRPVYVGGGIRPDIPDIPMGPSASQLPDFGMPDVGMMDMGGFDF
jgi:hypothetical protein